MKTINLARLIVPASLLAGLLCLPSMAVAQDFDDIYYNPDNDKKADKVKTVKKTTTRTKTVYVPTPDFEAAGNYNYTTGSNRDVDEYNRRYNDGVTVQTGDTVIDGDDFAYTRRIERFHNPEIIVETNDDELIEYYYETQPESPSVVVVDLGIDPWWSWNRPYYYYNPWTWSRPYYYNTWWGPSWSYGWYDPWYSWGWGPSYGWGWGPSYGWGWGGCWYPGHHYPGHGPGWGGTAWRPYHSPSGSSRPHASAGSNRRPGGSTGYTRPGSSAGRYDGVTPTARPGSGRYPATTTSPSNRWPATTSGSSSSSRPGATSTRGRGTSTVSGGYRGSSSSSSPSGSYSRPGRNASSSSSRSSYTPSRSSSSSRSSFSSGSSTRHSSGGYHGGGGRSSGGGRGRR